MRYKTRSSDIRLCLLLVWYSLAGLVSAGLVSADQFRDAKSIPDNAMSSTVVKAGHILVVPLPGPSGTRKCTGFAYFTPALDHVNNFYCSEAHQNFC
ncbi:hypothetical protein IFM89_033117 [Coptis chinensis]|uniref:Uncharacterized protein n=1 Tax=Coptis chinensis TaxID=261450 RepID=A0A835HGE8_9MAGN|nr:hypothetical protein IFM89_033117 [Coptis chinensis]